MKADVSRQKEEAEKLLNQREAEQEEIDAAIKIRNENIGNMMEKLKAEDAKSEQTGQNLDFLEEALTQEEEEELQKQAEDKKKEDEDQRAA